MLRRHPIQQLRLLSVAQCALHREFDRERRRAREHGLRGWWWADAGTRGSRFTASARWMRSPSMGALAARLAGPLPRFARGPGVSLSVAKDARVWRETRGLAYIPCSASAPISRSVRILFSVVLQRRRPLGVGPVVRSRSSRRELFGGPKPSRAPKSSRSPTSSRTPSYQRSNIVSAPTSLRPSPPTRSHSRLRPSSESVTSICERKARAGSRSPDLGECRSRSKQKTGVNETRRGRAPTTAQLGSIAWGPMRSAEATKTRRTKTRRGRAPAAVQVTMVAGRFLKARRKPRPGQIHIVNLTVNGGVLETTAWPALSSAGLKVRRMAH